MKTDNFNNEAIEQAQVKQCWETPSIIKLESDQTAGKLNFATYEYATNRAPS